MSASHHRHSAEKSKPAGPLRRLISALLSKPLPPPVAAKPSPPPKPKAPPPVQVLHLPKGVGTELRRAAGVRSAPPAVQVAPPVSDAPAAEEAQKVGSRLPAAREMKSVMRKLKAAPPVKPAQPGKTAATTRHPSKRTRHRDFPIA